MPIPFEPEELLKLQARFPRALEKIWQITFPMIDRPGLHREHVFDFKHGLRLLISRDNLHGVKIHVSASWERDEPKSLRDAHSQVDLHYKLLGGTGHLSYVGMSDNAIPHWVVEPIVPEMLVEPRTAAGSLD